MFGHPTCERRGSDPIAVARFQLGRGVGKRIAEMVERHAVEDDAERIGFVAQF